MLPGRHDWFYYTSTKCAIPDDIFAPIISKDEHLELHTYDPEDPERKIKDCAILRVYRASFDPKTGDRFSHLLGCQAIDLCRFLSLPLLL